MAHDISQDASVTRDKGKGAMVRQRVMIGTILIAAVLGLFWLDGHLSTVATESRATQLVDWRGLALHGSLITAVAVALTLATAAETTRFCRSAGMDPAGRWALACCGLLTIHPLIAHNIHDISTNALALIILVITLIGSVVMVMARGKTDGAIQNIASTWFTATYPGLLGSFIVRIRQDVPGALGAWILLWVIAVVKFTDIFAYGTGMAIGRHKLIPWLSPGKTWEGLAGGLAGAAVTAMFLLYASVIIGLDGIRHDIGSGTYLEVGLIGILLGAIGQLGDLMESLLKRGAKYKDSASLLPGFGGVFDLLDSLLLAAPAAWAVIRIFQHVSLIGPAAN